MSDNPTLPNGVSFILLNKSANFNSAIVNSASRFSPNPIETETSSGLANVNLVVRV